MHAGFFVHLVSLDPVFLCVTTSSVDRRTIFIGQLNINVLHTHTFAGKNIRGVNTTATINEAFLKNQQLLKACEATYILFCILCLVQMKKDKEDKDTFLQYVLVFLFHGRMEESICTIPRLPCC